MHSWKGSQGVRNDSYIYYWRHSRHTWRNSEKIQINTCKGFAHCKPFFIACKHSETEPKPHTATEAPKTPIKRRKQARRENIQPTQQNATRGKIDGLNGKPHNQPHTETHGEPQNKPTEPRNAAARVNYRPTAKRATEGKREAHTRSTDRERKRQTVLNSLVIRRNALATFPHH